ncbi:MAG TPA: universal stress protein [Byssovorax sp.]
MSRVHETLTPFVVLAAVDLSDASESIVDRALDLASDHPGASLHLVSVRELGLELLPPPHDLYGSPLYPLREIAAKAGVSARARGLVRVAKIVTHAAEGDPAAEIIALAADVDADLVVVGTHGRSGLRRALMGSVAEGVVRRAGCPVYVMRPKQHAHDRFLVQDARAEGAANAHPTSER